MKDDRILPILSRYHVTLEADGDESTALTTEFCRSRTDAYSMGHRWLQSELSKYPDANNTVVIFDSMARFGAVELWRLRVENGKPGNWNPVRWRKKEAA